MENIMLFENKATLTDFGGAVHVTWKRSSREVQSREYRSPEMILQDLWDERIDVWSLGCIVFEVATRKILFPPKWVAKKEK
jgi:serine/threonine protein kinase